MLTPGLDHVLAPSSDPVLAQILAAIAPASASCAQAMRDRLARFDSVANPGGAGGDEPDGDQPGGHKIHRLAARLAAARHTLHPSLEHKRVVVCAGDHGIAAPGLIPPGGHNPTLAAVERIAAGTAAINAAARAAGAVVIVVDCGISGGVAAARGVLDMRLGNGTADIRQGAAMSAQATLASLRTGVALMWSLADTGADVIALGQLGTGSQPVSSAVVAAFTDMGPGDVEPDQSAIVAAALAVNRPDPAHPIDVLAALGGFELGVMTGLILAASSIRVPVILDDHGTSAAALVAARLAPHVAGYLFASQAGHLPAQRRVHDELGLVSLFDIGLSSGEGTGAALALPFFDRAARLAAAPAPDGQQ